MALVALAEANEKTHPLASNVWSQSTECASRGISSVVRPGSERWAFLSDGVRKTGHTHTHARMRTGTYLLFSSSSKDTRVSRPELHRPATRLKL